MCRVVAFRSAKAAFFRGELVKIYDGLGRRGPTAGRAVALAVVRPVLSQARSERRSVSWSLFPGPAGRNGAGREIPVVGETSTIFEGIRGSRQETTHPRWSVRHGSLNGLARFWRARYRRSCRSPVRSRSCALGRSAAAGRSALRPSLGARRGVAVDHAAGREARPHGA